MDSCEADGIVGELAQVEVDHRARLDEIDASYEAHLEELRRLDAHPERWPCVLENFRARGEFVMTEARASAERSRMIREAEADHLRRLQALKLRQDVRAEAGKPQAENELAEVPQPKPRHRPPLPIPVEAVKQLKWELAQRKKRPPRDPDFTQEAIAKRLKLHPSRIQQAEALQRADWDLLRSDPAFLAEDDLLRSHPDFSVEEDFVRWPSSKKAAQILAFERGEN